MSDLSPSSQPTPETGDAAPPSSPLQALKKAAARLQDWFVIQSTTVKVMLIAVALLIPVTGLYSALLMQRQAAVAEQVKSMSAAEPIRARVVRQFCEAMAPEVFELDDDDFLQLHTEETTDENIDNVRRAVAWTRASWPRPSSTVGAPPEAAADVLVAVGEACSNVVEHAYPMGCDTRPGQVLVELEGSGVCASSIPVWEGRSWFEYPQPPGAPGGGARRCIH